MNIKRYKKNINIEHIKQVKNIKEITSQDGGVRMNAKTLQRPCTILQSIEESFMQIGEYKQGKRKFKSLKESQSLWDKWAKEVEEDNGGNDTNI
jgi:hypothetical protein